MFIDRLTQISRHNAKGLLVSILTLGSIATAPAFATSDFGPHTFYVSKNGNNTDGRTWATAWTDFDQIKWEHLNMQNSYRGADRLVIDGGARRMIYRKPLKIAAASSYFPFSISVSTEAGHNGQAVIMPPQDATAIEVTTTGHFQLNGSKRSGILIYGGREGIKVASNSAPYPITISNVEVARCSQAGITASSPYHPIGFNQVIVHDCGTNVIVPSVGHAPGGPRFDKCWIYNSSYGVNSDGISVQGSAGYGPPSTPFWLTNSILGPGLRVGVNCPTTQLPSLTNCLIINCTQSNFSGYAVRFENVTSFMTRLNPNKLAHSALRLQDFVSYLPMNRGYVKKSIVYGGVVDVPLTVRNGIPGPYGEQPQIPFPLPVESNTQFRTTGNTTLLSPTMVDPKFVMPVGLLPAVTPIPVLMNLDFSLKPNSPAQGTGCTITSIRNLLKSFN